MLGIHYKQLQFQWIRCNKSGHSMGWLTLLTFIFEWVSLCTEEHTVRRNLVYSAVGGNTNIITEILGNYAVRETQEWRRSTGQKNSYVFKETCWCLPLLLQLKAHNFFAGVFHFSLVNLLFVSQGLSTPHHITWITKKVLEVPWWDSLVSEIQVHKRGVLPLQTSTGCFQGVPHYPKLPLKMEY